MSTSPDCPAYFYPRSPCGERQGCSSFWTCRNDFYPRSPCGERRRRGDKAVLRYLISIHALLAESDQPTRRLPQRPLNFYPRSPCGERLGRYYASGGIGVFLSTLSLRRATHCSAIASAMPGFLSTLSLRRATSNCDGRRSDSGNFYPRSPCGERLCSVAFCLGAKAISIHALLAESDAQVC